MRKLKLVFVSFLLISLIGFSFEPTYADEIGNLIRKSKSKNLDIALPAIGSLGNIEDKRALDALIAILLDHSNDDKKRLEAINNMRGFQTDYDPGAMDSILKALEGDPYWEVRHYAGIIIEGYYEWGDYKDPKALGPVHRALKKDPHGVVREDAAEALQAMARKNIKNPAVVPSLIKALSDTNWGVREQAAYALGAYGDLDAVEPLIITLQDKGYNIRKAAAFALGELGDNRAVDHLLPLLTDDDKGVREYATNALKKLGVSEYIIKGAGINPREHLMALAKKLQEAPFLISSLRQEAIELTSRIDPPPAIPEEAIRHMAEGKAAFKMARHSSNYEEAEKSFLKAANLAPWWAPPYYNLALTKEKQRSFSEAISCLNYYLLAEPEAPDVGAVKEKIYELKYLEERKEQAEKHVILAAKLFDGNDYDGTVREASAAIELDPDSGEAHGWLGLGYNFQKRDKEAIVEMTEALRLGFERNSLKGWIGFYTNLGVSFARLGDREKAIAILNEGLDKTYGGNRGLAYFNLGHYCHQERRYQEAINYYQIALSKGYTDKAEVEKRINQCKRDQR